MVSAGHVSEFLGVGGTVAYRRLRLLTGAGLLRYERVFHARPGVYMITGGGLGVAESPLSVPKLDLHVYRHDLSLPGLYLAARAGVFGDCVTNIWSERQVVRHERFGDVADRPCLGVPMWAPDRYGNTRSHAPDLVIDHRGGVATAVELELSVKSARRLQEIMSAYLTDHVVQRVFYLTDQRSVADAVSKAAANVGVVGKITIVPVALPLGTETLGAAVALAGGGVFA